MSTIGAWRRGRRAIPAALAIWLAAGAAVAGVTPILGSVQASVTVSTDLLNNFGDDDDDWAGVPADLSARASAFTFGLDGAMAFAEADIAASWASATQGAVSFDDFGWRLSSTPGDLARASLGPLGPDWTYTFIPDVDSVLTMNFLVSLTGTAQNFTGWRLLDNGVVVSSAATAPSMGTISHALSGGDIHILTLESNNSGAAFIQALDGAMDGTFSWRIDDAPIAPIPEPETWTLAIVGLGLCGAMLRRRRREALAVS